MRDLPPASRSQVVLIGCDRYRHLTDLPAVARNVEDLARALRDPALFGVPAANCATVLGGPGGELTVSGVIGAVRHAADQVGSDGLLLLYYAGHGLVENDSGRLHLAVTGTERDQEDATAVAYESIRRRVWQSRARYKIVILDCCYAGRALLGEMSAADLVEDLEIDQSVIIAATSRNRAALAPRGERHTAFTGAMLSVIARGIADGPAVVDARSLWQQILRIQAAKGLPRPEFRSRNAADDLPLVRNAWSTRARETPMPARVRADRPAPNRGTALHQAKAWRRLTVAAGLVALAGTFVTAGLLTRSGDPDATPARGPEPTPNFVAPVVASVTPSAPVSAVRVTGECADQDLSLTPVPAAMTVRPGAALAITVKIKNISNRSCTRDLGADPQETYLDLGAQKLWSSDTCSSDRGTYPVTMRPGGERNFNLTWNGRQSSKCSGTLPSGQALDPGVYQLRTRLGAKVSEPVAVTVEQ